MIIFSLLLKVVDVRGDAVHVIPGIVSLDGLVDIKVTHIDAKTGGITPVVVPRRS